MCDVSAAAVSLKSVVLLDSCFQLFRLSSDKEFGAVHSLETRFAKSKGNGHRVAIMTFAPHMSVWSVTSSAGQNYVSFPQPFKKKNFESKHFKLHLICTFQLELFAVFRIISFCQCFS